MLVVDTGVLLAAADAGDPDHAPCAELLRSEAGPLLTTAFVVAEAAYLIGRRLCPTAEAAFFRSVARGDLLVEPMTAADLGRIADLVERYVDLPLGGADASLVALAERLKETRIATLDHRHFRVVRPVHVPGFELVP